MSDTRRKPHLEMLLPDTVFDPMAQFVPGMKVSVIIQLPNTVRGIDMLVVKRNKNKLVLRARRGDENEG